jgi:hypothetical protein
MLRGREDPRVFHFNLPKISLLMAMMTRNAI